MAFLRRSARIARYLAASPQNCVRTVIRPNQRLFVVVEHNARQAFHSSSRLTNTETAVSHSAIDDDFGDFIKNIQHQEHDIFHQVVFSEKRFGRVTKLQVTRMFDSLCKTGFATARTVQQLTRYCGSLMAEVPAIERTKLVHEIWDKVEDLGFTFNTAVYNTLLDVYLQNEHKTSPSELLEKMEAKGVKPNLATYKKLVGVHCQQGDMEGARRVLEIMKSADMPVTNTVFRYLIMGHARAGDMESAKGILDQMRSVSLEPSVKTHVALMCAYAEKGDIDNIREILTNLKTEGNAVPSIYLLSVIHSLAASGNKQHIQEILDQISFESLSQPDIINLCITLITEEHDDVAFEILKPHLKESQQKMNLVEGQESQKANFFIRQIVKLERPIEEINKYLQELKSFNLRIEPCRSALRSALDNKNSEYAFALLKNMRDNGYPLRPHYLWPLLADCQKNNDVKGLSDIENKAREMYIAFSMDSYQLYIFPTLGGGEATELMQKMKDLNMSVDKLTVASLIKWEISKQRIKNIPSLLDEIDAALLEFHLFAFNFGQVFVRKPDVEFITKLVCHDKLKAYIGFFLDQLLRQIGRQETPKLSKPLEDLFTALNEQGVKITNHNLRQISSSLDHLGLSDLKDKAKQLMFPWMSELASDGQLSYDRTFRDYRQMRYIAHSGGGAELMNLAAKIERGEEVDFKTEIENWHPQYRLATSNCLNIVKLLTVKERIEDAMDLLQELKNRSTQSSNDIDFFELFSGLSRDGFIEEAKHLLNKSIEIRLLKPSTYVLGSLLDGYFEKGDLKGAMDYIEDCYARFEMAPRFYDLLVKLIEAGNTEQLQTAMECGVQMLGNRNSLYTLIFAFLTTGKYNQAKSIIETSELVAVQARLQWYARLCIRMGLEEPLEKLIELSRNMLQCNRDQMYHHLLTLYAKTKDWQKCMKAWSSIQEEGFKPTPRTLRLLAHVLKTNGQPIPLEVSSILENDNAGER